jgi:hypothetical protein
MTDERSICLCPRFRLWYVDEETEASSSGAKKAMAAIRAVLDLHVAVDQYDWNPDGHCKECNDTGWEGCVDGAQPVDWPCPTLVAIASALGVREDGE